MKKFEKTFVNGHLQEDVRGKSGKANFPIFPFKSRIYNKPFPIAEKNRVNSDEFFSPYIYPLPLQKRIYRKFMKKNDFLDFRLKTAVLGTYSKAINRGLK